MSNIKKPLSSAQISAMKPGDSDLADTSENRGLRVNCAKGGSKSFFFRYTSPLTGRLVQVQMGYFPSLSLAEVRVKLHDLKKKRRDGRCPATEKKEEKIRIAEEENLQSKVITVKQVIDLYLEQYIEDRVVKGKIILGARTRKGQSEARRTLYGDAVRVLGDKPAHQVTRKNVVDMVMEIVSRGANVQAGNVLRELASAYEYAIGLERFKDDFANPGLLAKASLRQTKIKLTSNKGKRVLSDKELTINGVSN